MRAKFGAGVGEERPVFVAVAAGESAEGALPGAVVQTVGASSTVCGGGHAAKSTRPAVQLLLRVCDRR